ncbi:DUF3027 domain-containing protein [Microbacterium sp. Sa4CUA7]|uniref:DUF3027 domain-containing protein n=1 Tax=Microbacterium pullorum TaxID=2762236 RepID=A0ABR8RYR0_9MICO|nr:DUF3027 domain-containing protein [Microbacterium pullorum]MBD7956381.1 DUF3027 domain-containing protein [Microbacterium pullorum]
MTSKPEVADERLLGAHDLALAALREVTPESTIGDAAGYTLEEDGVVSLRFNNRLAGYPGWFWTVSVAAVEGAEPTVLEVELLPGDGALLAPEWVPWAVRLAEYQAAQAVQAAVAAESGEGAASEDDDEEDADVDDLDDLDASDFDDDGSAILHGGDLDGVDIDELDESGNNDDESDDDSADSDDDSEDGDDSEDDEDGDDDSDEDGDDEDDEPENDAGR